MESKKERVCRLTSKLKKNTKEDSSQEGLTVKGGIRQSEEKFMREFLIMVKSQVKEPLHTQME